MTGKWWWRSDSPVSNLYNVFFVMDNKILDVKNNRGVSECMDG